MHQGAPGQSAAQVFVGGANGGWNRQSRFTDAANDFGESASLDGDTLAIGSPEEDIEGSLSSGYTKGAVHVFVRDREGEWTRQARLTAPGYGTLEFGRIVSLDGDTLAVGATTGVHMFGRDDTGKWSWEGSLGAPSSSSNFGASISVDGHTLVVGAPWSKGYAGTVHVFVRDSANMWREQAYLEAPGDGSHQYFGGDVSLDDDTLAVGAVGDTSNIYDHDSPGAYVFTRDNKGQWSLQAKCAPGGHAGGTAFGGSVSLDGNVLAVGATGDPLNQSYGAIYLFARDAEGRWNLRFRVVAPEPSFTGYFGSQISLDGDTLVATEPGRSAVHVLSFQATE